MYTLRIIESPRDLHEMVVTNLSLGNWYKVANPETDFFKDLRQQFPEFTKTARMVVIPENGDIHWILNDNEFTQRSYYIMTESGKTFEKL